MTPVMVPFPRRNDVDDEIVSCCCLHASSPASVKLVSAIQERTNRGVERLLCGEIQRPWNRAKNTHVKGWWLFEPANV